MDNNLRLALDALSESIAERKRILSHIHNDIQHDHTTGEYEKEKLCLELLSESTRTTERIAAVIEILAEPLLEKQKNS